MGCQRAEREMGRRRRGKRECGEKRKGRNGEWGYIRGEWQTGKLRKGVRKEGDG